MSAIQKLATDVVVQLFVDRGPIRLTRRNRMVLVADGNLDGQLRSMTCGFQAGEFEPGRDDVRPALAAEAVHTAMQKHGRQTVPMWFENPIDGFQIFHV